MTTTNIEPLQVTIEEAARLLSVSRQTVYRLLWAHKLQVTGQRRGRRITTASIKRYVAESAETNV